MANALNAQKTPHPPLTEASSDLSGRHLKPK